MISIGPGKLGFVLLYPIHNAVAKVQHYLLSSTNILHQLKAIMHNNRIGCCYIPISIFAIAS